MPAVMSAPNSPKPPQAPQPKNKSAQQQPRVAAPPRVQVRNPLPEITFPEELPVSGRRQEISEALQANQVIIVSGETGSGKTTQLPKICLQLGRGEKGLIGHTQPRRIAASSTAKRIAQELGTPPGEHVGFKVRFNDTLSKGARHIDDALSQGARLLCGGIPEGNSQFVQPTVLGDAHAGLLPRRLPRC